MHRVIVATVLAVATMLALTSCGQTEVKAADVYSRLLPAVDLTVEGGSMVGKVTVTGLKKLSQSGKLDPEAQRWLDETISLLDSKDPENPAIRRQEVDHRRGCANTAIRLAELDVISTGPDSCGPAPTNGRTGSPRR